MSLVDTLAQFGVPLAQAGLGWAASEEIEKKVPQIGDAPMLGWNSSWYTGEKGNAYSAGGGHRVEVPTSLQATLPEKLQGGMPSFLQPEEAQALALSDLARTTAAAKTAHDRSVMGLMNLGKLLQELPGVREAGEQEFLGTRQRGLAAFKDAGQKVDDLLYRSKSLKQEVLGPAMTQLKGAMQAMTTLREQTRSGLLDMARQVTNEVASMMGAARQSIDADIQTAIDTERDELSKLGMGPEALAISENSIRLTGGAAMRQMYNALVGQESSRMMDFMLRVGEQLSQADQLMQSGVVSIAGLGVGAITQAVLSSADLQKSAVVLNNSLKEAQANYDLNATIAMENWIGQMRIQELSGNYDYVAANMAVGPEPVAILSTTLLGIQNAFKSEAYQAWATKAGLDISNFANATAPTMAWLGGAMTGLGSFSSAWQTQKSYDAAQDQADAMTESAWISGGLGLGGDLLGAGIGAGSGGGSSEGGGD